MYTTPTGTVTVMPLSKIEIQDLKRQDFEMYSYIGMATMMTVAFSIMTLLSHHVSLSNLLFTSIGIGCLLYLAKKKQDVRTKTLQERGFEQLDPAQCKLKDYPEFLKESVKKGMDQLKHSWERAVVFLKSDIPGVV